MLMEGVPTDLTAYFRAGNAVATMAFGLLGCLLGPLALKAAKRDTQASSA
jgi:hypothetical protein